MKSLISTIILLLFSKCLVSAQDHLWKSDSLRVDSIYNVAVEFSNKIPQRAGDELQKLINIIDNELLDIHTNQSYLLERKATAKHFLAYFKRRESSFHESLKLYLESIEIKKQINDTLSIPKSLNQLGFLWLYQEQYDKALDYFLQAKTLSETYKTTDETISILSNLGTTYLFQKDFDKAKAVHQRALMLADSLKNKRLIALSSANYAILLRKLKLYKDNIPYVEKSIQLHKELNNDIGLESGLFALGVSYRKLDQPKKAITYFHQAIELSNQLNNAALLPSRYLSLSNAYEDAGNIKLALEYFRKYEKALMARKNQAELKKMADLEASYKYQQQKITDSLRLEKENALKAQEIKAQSKQNMTIIISIALSIILIIMLAYFFLRQKKLMAEQKVLQKIKENYELSKTISEKESQVSDLMDETIKQLKKKKHLEERLTQIKKEDRTGDLKHILLDIQTDKYEDSKSLLIKENIELHHSEFLSSLKTKHSDLSKTDLEIASYTKLKLSRKEIADLRGSSVEAVKSAKARLKKKLKLSPDVSLDDYLGSL